MNFTTVANAGQESTSYTVTGLKPNTTYYFQIVGSNSAGSSGPSNIATATTTNQTGQTPTAPQGLGATPASGSEVYLTWTNTATNETGFVLTRATDSLFTQNVVTQTLASAPYYYTDGAAGLSPGNTYYYKLQATNSSGLSSSSNTASVNIPNVPPAPTNAAAVQSGNSVVLSWTDHAGPFALGYQISRSVDGGPYTIYADRPETSDSPPSTQTFTDTNVPLGHTYSYEIVAENVSGFSAPAYATASVLGLATLTLGNGGNLAFTVSPGAPDRLSVQLAAGIYTLTDPAVTIAVTGAGAGFVTGAGTSTVTIPAAHVSAMTLDTSDNTDTISIISDAVPITITADSGGGNPTINLGDPTQNEIDQRHDHQRQQWHSVDLRLRHHHHHWQSHLPGGRGRRSGWHWHHRHRRQYQSGPGGQPHRFRFRSGHDQRYDQRHCHLGIRPGPGAHRHLFQPSRCPET